MNNQTTIFDLDDLKKYVHPVQIPDENTRFEDTKPFDTMNYSTKNANQTEYTPDLFLKENTKIKPNENKINYSVKNVEKDVNDTSNYMIDIFSKSHVIIFAWFVVIYFVIYILIQNLLKKTDGVSTSSSSMGFSVETHDTSTSRLVDFTLLIVFIVLCVVGYKSLSKYDQEHFMNYCLKWMKDDLNDPSSIFIFSFLLLSFYLTVYLLNIPMGFDTKPLSISIIENKLWIWLIIIIIVTFFKYILNISIVDWIYNWFSDIWSTNNFNSAPTNKYHNIFVDNGGDFKIVDNSQVVQGSGSGSGSSVESQTNQVFNVGNNMYTYDDAQAVCKSFDARLATYSEIEQSYNDGAEWCNYGWSDKQMAFFPTQKETWDKLQNTENHKNDCGRPGVNGGYMANPNIKFGVNCFGKKPKAKDTDLLIMKGRQNNSNYVQPISAQDKELQKKADYWKNNEDKLQINSFNIKKWSEY